MTLRSNNRGSVTLTFEAIFLFAMLGAGLAALALATKSGCQSMQTSQWINCGSVLDCEVEVIGDKCNPLIPTETGPVSDGKEIKAK